jgi:hypothetical protein
MDEYLAAERALRLGDVHYILSEYDAARQQYEAALPIFRELGIQVGEASCIRALGETEIMS